jgi:hypothetical protein
MSQLTRSEVTALLRKAAEQRRKIAQIEADLKRIAARISRAGPKPDPRQPASRKK